MTFTGANQNYVTFQLGEEQFAIEVMKVQEILEMVKITPVPETSAEMKGIINLRGQVMPVVDARLKFGMPEKSYTSRTRIIVINLAQEVQGLFIGLIVDGVSSVIELPEESILPPLQFNDFKEAAYISGIAKIGQEFMMILEIGEVLFSDGTLQSKHAATEV